MGTKRNLETVSNVVTRVTKKVKIDPLISIPPTVLSSAEQTKFKFLCWNVNGLNALLKKGDYLRSLLSSELPDILCLQETKLRKDNECKFIDLHDLYTVYFNSSTKKLGYSGTAILIRKDFEEVHKPTITFGYTGVNDLEGRTLTVETEKFFIVNTYVPNSGQNLKRLVERTTIWDTGLLKYLNSLQEKKPVIWCGDLNVARHEHDLHSPKTNLKTAGYTPEERASFENVFSAGYIDTFRELYPDKKGAYSYWSYRRQSREKNNGWRLDYFITSPSLKNYIHDALILSDVIGSDHCPIGLLLDYEKKQEIVSIP